MSFWVQFDDETKWVVRFPMIGAIAREHEKVKTEVATMMFLSEKTTIPTPQLIGYVSPAIRAIALDCHFLF